MGAKKLYSDEQLLRVVDKYFERNKVVDTVSAEAIAKFATEELGMLSKNGTPLSAKLFRRNNKVMELLKTYNEDNFIPDSVERAKRVLFTDMNVKKFVNTYKSKPKMMIAMLTHHQESYRLLMDETVELEKNLGELKRKYNELQSKFKEVKNENQRLTDENRKILNFKNFQRDMEMLNYLVEKGYIDSVSEANIELAGRRAGIIDVELNDEENRGKSKIKIPESITKQIPEGVKEQEISDSNQDLISIDEVKAKKAKSFWSNLNT